MGYFTSETFEFLEKLAANNDRQWFAAHKMDYENFVREPALDFIADMADRMESFAPHFMPLAKKVGGSLMRIQKDTRLSRDKSPYKTNIGIHIRHELGRDVHAPGYYLHIEPGACFAGVGIWHPDADTLFRIRSFIAENSEKWLKSRDDAAFIANFRLEGDSLANPPRGFAKDHPLLADLKRKDFTAMADLEDGAALSKNLLNDIAEKFASATPFMSFLCGSIGVGF